MPNKNDLTRAQAAVRTMEHTRAEARALLMPHRCRGPDGQSSAFPRSKTFRWLLSQPVGRWFGSALLTVAISRLPLGRFLATALLARRSPTRRTGSPPLFESFRDFWPCSFGSNWWGSDERRQGYTSPYSLVDELERHAMRVAKSTRSLGFRIRGRNAAFCTAVRQRDRDRGDLDFRNAIVLRDPDRLCRGRREINDPTLHIRPAVSDRDYRALAGFHVGYRRSGTQWKRLTRGVFAVRIHFGAVRHFSARKLIRIVRCVAETRAARQVRQRP